MRNLTTDEIQLLSYFSEFTERNKGKLLESCIILLSEQYGMDFNEYSVMSLNSEEYFDRYTGFVIIKEKDSRFTQTK